MLKKKIKHDHKLCNLLISRVKKDAVVTHKDFEKLLDDLYEICDKFLKDKRKPQIRNQQIRKILMVIYASWDYLIDSLNKEGYLITNMLKVGSYKKMMELEAKKKGYFNKTSK